MQRLTAGWLLPVAGPPIRHGAVLVDARGRIAAVGPDARVPAPPDAAVIALPDAALLPGLVNTHTHLELTGFAGMVEADSFLDWIRKVIAVKARRSEEAFFEAACTGIRQMWARGVTTVADTGSTGAVLEALDDLGASGTYHHEVFGAHPEECPGAMRRFARDLDRLAGHAGGRAALGVSPHAPYTVSGALYRAASDLGRAHGVPIAVHVAEPPDESALLDDFTGVFADDFRRRGVPRPTSAPTTPMAFMDRHGVLSSRTLCIHAIHVSEADTALMARHGCAVAHCPRSNRFHHGADAPAARYLERGLRLGLGTDSEISVDPPDLLAEAREARRLAGWDAATTLRLLTLGGAAAIERDAECGSLEVGKWGDLAAIRVGETDDPEEAVLAAELSEVVGTWLGGRRVHG